MADEGPIDWRAKLTTYFEQVAPDKLPQVDAFLHQYAGKEDAMMKALVKKYGHPTAPKPKDQVAREASFSGVRRVQSVVAFNIPPPAGDGGGADYNSGPESGGESGSPLAKTQSQRFRSNASRKKGIEVAEAAHRAKTEFDAWYNPCVMYLKVVNALRGEEVQNAAWVKRMYFLMDTYPVYTNILLKEERDTRDTLVLTDCDELFDRQRLFEAELLQLRTMQRHFREAFVVLEAERDARVRIADRAFKLARDMYGDVKKSYVRQELEDEVDIFFFQQHLDFFERLEVVTDELHARVRIMNEKEAAFDDAAGDVNRWRRFDEDEAKGRRSLEKKANAFFRGLDGLFTAQLIAQFEEPPARAKIEAEAEKFFDGALEMWGRSVGAQPQPSQSSVAQPSVVVPPSAPAPAPVKPPPPPVDVPKRDIATPPSVASSEGIPPVPAPQKQPASDSESDDDVGVPTAAPAKGRLAAVVKRVAAATKATHAFASATKPVPAKPFRHGLDCDDAVNDKVEELVSVATLPIGMLEYEMRTQWLTAKRAILDNLQRRLLAPLPAPLPNAPPVVPATSVDMILQSRTNAEAQRAVEGSDAAPAGNAALCMACKSPLRRRPSQTPPPVLPSLKPADGRSTIPQLDASRQRRPVPPAAGRAARRDLRRAHVAPHLLRARLVGPDRPVGLICAVRVAPRGARRLGPARRARHARRRRHVGLHVRHAVGRRRRRVRGAVVRDRRARVRGRLVDGRQAVLVALGRVVALEHDGLAHHDAVLARLLERHRVRHAQHRVAALRLGRLDQRAVCGLRGAVVGVGVMFMIGSAPPPQPAAGATQTHVKSLAACQRKGVAHLVQRSREHERVLRLQSQRRRDPRTAAHEPCLAVRPFGEIAPFSAE